MTKPMTIQQIADVQEIAAIRPKFGRAADARDFAAMEALFEPEVDTDMSEFGIPAARLARADLVAMFRHAFRHDAVRTQQLYGSITVEVEGDRATCRSYLHGTHVGKTSPAAICSSCTPNTPTPSGAARRGGGSRRRGCG